MGRKFLIPAVSPDERRACNAIAARQGYPQALVELQKEPEYLNDLLDQYAGLRQRVEELWTKKISGSDLLATERIAREIGELRIELGGANPSKLKKIVVDRIIVSWLQASLADLADAGEDPTEKTKWIEEVRDRSSRRFLRACRILAQIQKLLGPNIQLNIAEKQINVFAAGDQKSEGGNSQHDPEKQ